MGSEPLADRVVRLLRGWGPALALGVLACLTGVTIARYGAQMRTPTYSIVRQCRCGASWLMRDGRGRTYLRTSTELDPVAPDHADDACPPMDPETAE